MNSTLTRTAAPAPAWSGAALVDALLLPAATCAPAALVIAVDTRVSQETSVLVQDVVAGGNGSGIAGRNGSGIASGIESGMSDDAVALTSVLAAAYAAPAAVVPAAAFRTRKHVQGPPSRGTPV